MASSARDDAGAGKGARVQWVVLGIVAATLVAIVARPRGIGEAWPAAMGGVAMLLLGAVTLIRKRGVHVSTTMYMRVAALHHAAGAGHDDARALAGAEVIGRARILKMVCRSWFYS